MSKLMALPIESSFSSYAESSVKKKHQDPLDTIAKFLSEEGSLFFKSIYTGIDFAGVVLDRIPEQHKEIIASTRLQANLIKLAYAPKSLLKNFNDLRHKANNFWEDHSSENGQEVFLAANKCISPLYDGTDFFTKAIFYLPRNSVWFQNFTGVNAISLIIASTQNIYNDLTKMAKANYAEAKNEAEKQQHREKITEALFDLIKDISFIALGILTTLSVFFAFVFSPATFVMLSTSTVVFSIINFYYKNLGAPLESKAI